MKTNHFSANYKTFIVATACLLASVSLHAQTFTGQEKLTSTPTSFEANAYPITGSPVIRVNYNNLTAGGVTVAILNENGDKVYSAFETTAAYRRRFDLSAMSPGKYTLELSKKGDKYSQTFTIEPPTMSYVTMEYPPVRKTPEAPVDKKLIVSQ